MKQMTQNTDQVIKDIRPGYLGQITIIKFRPSYAGSPIQELIKDESNPRNKHYYNIIQYGVNVGTIAISEDDYKTIYELLNPNEP